MPELTQGLTVVLTLVGAILVVLTLGGALVAGNVWVEKLRERRAIKKLVDKILGIAADPDIRARAHRKVDEILKARTKGLRRPPSKTFTQMKKDRLHRKITKQIARESRRRNRG